MDRATNGQALVSQARLSNTMLRANKKGRRYLSGGSLPPEMNVVPFLRRTFRFYANAAFSGNISNRMIAGMCGGIVTTANTTFYTVASTMKVNRVSIWPGLVAAASQPPAIPTVQWYTPVSGVEKDIEINSAVPSGVSVDKPVVSTPPRGSLAGMWFPCFNTNDIFGMTGVTAGSIIDVDVTYTNPNAYSNLAVTITSTAAVGAFVYGYLDATGGKLVPVGLTGVK